MTLELLPEQLSKIEEMSALLRISEDCTIAFVRCNEPVLLDAVNEEIQKMVSDEVFIYDIEMDENFTNLLSLLNEAVGSELYASKIKDNKKVAFFVFGLDKAMDKKTSEGRKEALIILNTMREEFLKIKHAILIWINSASMSYILKEAQDFFSWRTTVFEFESEPMEVGMPVEEFGETDVIFSTGQELEEKWENYSRLLKEYQEKGIKDAHKFAYWNYNLGMIKLLKGHAVDAIEYFKKVLEISHEIGNRQNEVIILGNLGNAYHILGEMKKSIEYYENALKIAREIGDRKSEGVQIGNLGNVYRILGETRKSIGYYENALKIAQEIGDQRNEGIWLGNLGIDYRLLGEMEKAINYNNKALKIAEKLEDRRNESRWLTNIGLVHRDNGSLNNAVEYYTKALKISYNIDDRRNIGFLYGEIGYIHHSLGEIEKAVDFYEKALKIAQDIGDRSNESKWLGKLGNAYRDYGDVKKAIWYYIKALKIAHEIENKRFEGRWLNDLGVVFKNEKQYKEALACLLIAKNIRIQIDDIFIKTTESNLKKFEKDLGEKEFEKLKAKITPRASEILNNILETPSE